MKLHAWDIEIILFDRNKVQEYSSSEENIVFSFSKILNAEAEWFLSSKYTEIKMDTNY